MNDPRFFFIESAIIEAVKKLLTGPMNELFGTLDSFIPSIEFSKYSGSGVVIPKITINACEQTEKERLILLNAYSLSITFNLPDLPDGELYTFVYCCAADKVFRENPTLYGTVNRIALTRSDIIPPKLRSCGDDWRVVLTLRVTVEGTIYACTWA